MNYELGSLAGMCYIISGYEDLDMLEPAACGIILSLAFRHLAPQLHYSLHNIEDTLWARPCRSKKKQEQGGLDMHFAQFGIF